ncbi:MAG: hypothetical protein FWH26_10425 [Oscillospiraceae bacterium]|nr:hypothetical protein [Oscillospiraceae bacterium]
MKCSLKKIMKVIGIILAIAAAAAAVYLVVKKLQEKKQLAAEGIDDLESFVSCSCLDDEPIVVDDQPAA